MKNSVSIYNEIINTEKSIIIPEYQREYSWEKDDVEIFLDDIIKEIENDSDFYIGTMYAYEPIDRNEIHIIDGQQRLTTTILFLYTIIEKIREGDNFADFLYLSDGADKLKSDNEALNKAYRYHLYDAPDEVSDDIRNNQIQSNLKIIEERLKEMDKSTINAIEGWIKNRIKASIVKVNEVSDAMSIFMNLNARGKELSAIEIIKVNVFSYILEIDKGEDELSRLKKTFSDLIYNTGSSKYNDNVKYFKKNLYLYISYKDSNRVKEFKLKEGDNDKVFASAFMKIILHHYDLKRYEDMLSFIEEFESFTNTYIWWNLKMINKYKSSDMEKKYREAYKNINKKKANDIAVLISFSNEENRIVFEAGYQKVLEIFSIIELRKAYNEYILKTEKAKISLDDISTDRSKIIETLKACDNNTFIEVFNKDNYRLEEKKLDELKNYIKENKNDIPDKDIEVIRYAVNNIKGS